MPSPILMAFLSSAAGTIGGPTGTPYSGGNQGKSGGGNLFADFIKAMEEEKKRKQAQRQPIQPQPLPDASSIWGIMNSF